MRSVMKAVTREVMKKTVMRAGLALLALFALTACSNSAEERALLEAIEVNELNVVSLSLSSTANTTVLEAGTLSSFAAMAQVSNGGADVDVSDQVTWSSSDSAVFGVSQSGEVTANNIDSSATLYIDWADLSASQLIMVSTAALDTITFVGAPSAVNVCANGIQLQVEGTYAEGEADERTVDISDLVSWSSSAESLALVDTSGVLETFGSGNATISASRSPASGTLALTINDTIFSVAVTPDTAVTVDVGSTLQFTATATYDDTSTADITSTATWEPGTANLSFSASNGSEGLATGVIAGSANVTASCNVTVPETSPAIAVTVETPKTLTGIEIRYSNSSLDVNKDVTDSSPLDFKAILKYSDGTDGVEVTTDDDTDWRVSDEISGESASVNNSGDDKGEVGFSAVGSTEIEVRYDPGTGSALVDTIVLDVD